MTPKSKVELYAAIRRDSRTGGLSVRALATCDWVRKGQPLCLIGDSGTGKSHLLIALGTEAAMAGFRVRYVLAAKLVNELAEAADEKLLTRTIARYGRVDLLCIDELGYMELDKRGAELLFQVLTEREEKNSVAIASNESLSKAHLFARTCARRCRSLTGSSPKTSRPMIARSAMVPGCPSPTKTSRPCLLLRGCASSNGSKTTSSGRTLPVPALRRGASTPGRTRSSTSTIRIWLSRSTPGGCGWRLSMGSSTLTASS